MNTSYIQTLADESIKTIGVQYFSEQYGTYLGQVYTYKTKATFEEGDLAITLSPSGYRIVKVVTVDNIPNISADSQMTYKWIHQKVEQETYEAGIEHDQKFKELVQEKSRAAHRVEAMKVLTSHIGEDGLKAIESFEPIEVVSKVTIKDNSN